MSTDNHRPSLEEGLAITERLLLDLGINEQNCFGTDANEQADYLFGEIMAGRMRCPFCGIIRKHTERCR